MSEQTNTVRAAHMRLMSRCPHEALARYWRDCGLAVEATDLRRPETGLVTVRGRVGGDGQAFNLGEATVTRASVKLSSGEIGHAYILGRETEKARLCATIDAALQNPGLGAIIVERVLQPIGAQLDEADRKMRAQVAATRVDFFTMTRGED